MLHHKYPYFPYRVGQKWVRLSYSFIYFLVNFLGGTEREIHRIIFTKQLILSLSMLMKQSHPRRVLTNVVKTFAW